jgi:hypothetical protein
MKKKLIGIFVCILFLLPTCTTIVDASFNTNIFTNSYIIYNKEIDKGISFLFHDDGLDQENTDWKGSGLAGLTYPMAQSFKPTLNLLTRVELIAWRVGNPQGNLTISIRENLSGTDLTNVSILAENIPLEYGPPAIWTGFDLPNINVIPEHTYYIVWSHDSWDHDNHVAWGDTRSTDHYPRGEVWWILNDTWVPRGPNYDFCFKTYRWLNNTSPGKPDIDGPGELEPGTEYPYYFYSNDPDDDNIFYYVFWGDGTTTYWVGPYASGEKIYKSHKWSEEGTYIIKAKARDEHGNESDLTEFEIEISNPRTRAWLRFIDLFPILQRMLDLWR